MSAPIRFVVSLTDEEVVLFREFAAQRRWEDRIVVKEEKTPVPDSETGQFFNPCWSVWLEAGFAGDIFRFGQFWQKELAAKKGGQAS